MSKPATDMRLARAAEGFTQVISRGDAHIVTKNPTTGKCCYDGQVGGGWHYQNNTLEADSAWQADTGAWQYKIEKLDGFKINARNILNAGNVLQLSDVASGESITFQPLALNWVDNATDSRQQITQPQAVTAQVTDDVLYFSNGYGTGRHFKYVASVSRLNKLLIIDSASNLPAPTVSNPYLEIEFIITPSSGVSLVVDGATWDKKTKKNTANAIAFRTSGGVTVWSFAAPMAYDSAGSETPGILQLRKRGANFYATVRFPKSWIDSAQFPITLDPTIDKQTAASADDGYVWEGIGFNNSGTTVACGSYYNHPYSVFARWTGITIPSGATIDVAYVSVYYDGVVYSTPGACTVRFNDELNPAAITSTSDWSSNAKTTASVSWTPPTGDSGWKDSPSLISIIEELMASFTAYDDDEMQLMWSGITSGGYAGYRSYRYTGNVSGPKLHIEYTEAAAGGSLVIPSRRRRFQALLVR